MEKLVGLKELRQNMKKYIDCVNKGESLIIIRKSTPLFKISPIENESEDWEEVIDFTKIKKGGVNIQDILSRI